MNLLISLLKIGSITFISRILGFIRDIIIARMFGAGTITDAFFIAFKLPNILRHIFAEGAFSQAFIPILIEYKKNKDINKIKILIQHISGILIIMLFCIIIISVYFSPNIIKLFAPGFTKDYDKFLLTLNMFRITIYYIFFISIVSLSGSILNTYNYFIIPSFSPVLLNISIISCLLISEYVIKKSSIMILAWSVIIGGILQLGYNLIYLKKINMLVIPKFNFYNPVLYKFLKKMSMLLLSVSVSQISVIINSIISSLLVSGTISWLYYANRIIALPISMLGITLSNVLLPVLTMQIINKKYKEYYKMMDYSLRFCFILGFPIFIALIILSKSIIIALFQYGKFSEFDTFMTQKSLIAHSVGLLGIILVKIFTVGFLARQYIYIPMTFSIITLIMIQIMNIIFVGTLMHVGLSLSIGIGSCINALLLYWKSYKLKLFIPQPGWKFFFYA